MEIELQKDHNGKESQSGILPVLNRKGMRSPRSALAAMVRAGRRTFVSPSSHGGARYLKLLETLYENKESVAAETPPLASRAS